jgi:hypothetical protein
MNRNHRLTLLVALTILSWPLASLAQASAPLLAADTTPEASVANQAPETAAPNTPPDITIPDPLFTFDPVVDGTEVVHDFRVYNRGKGALAIEKVQTG